MKKKTIAEADSNGDMTDSAVAVTRASTRADPAPPPTKKTKVAPAEKTMGKNGKPSSHHIQD